eukprot:1367067-Amorphochlora_amoeboformis.AAC.1
MSGKSIRFEENLRRLQEEQKAKLARIADKERRVKENQKKLQDEREKRAKAKASRRNVVLGKLKQKGPSPAELR